MRWFVLVCLFGVSLAGCSDGAAVIDPCEEDSASCGPAVAEDDIKHDKGIIRGVVIDPAIVPIPDATVSLTGTELVATTDASGGFVFLDLEPGSYFLQVDKLGFSSVQQSVDVVAGKLPPTVKVQLRPDATTAPFYQATAWAGHLGCSVRAVARGLSCPGADVAFPEHSFLTDIPLSQVPDWVVSEMVWETTQTLGGEMSYNLRRTDTNQDTKDIEGSSPLGIALNETDIVFHEAPDGDPMGGFGPEMDLRVIVFTAHLQETEPGCLPADPPELPQCPWGVGLQLDQPFETFTHVFFNYQPPEAWRFLADAIVPTA